MTDKMREAFANLCKECGPTISFYDFEMGWDAAQSEQSAELERLRNRVARAERDLSVVMAEGHRLMCDWQEQVRKTCAALKQRNDAEQERDALRKDAERLRDALKYYGTHSNACDMSRFVSPAGCTCGYSAAIAAEGEKE